MSGEQHPDVKVVQSVTVEAVVIRADGTREEHGVVAEWHADDQPVQRRSVAHRAAREREVLPWPGVATFPSRPAAGASSSRTRPAAASSGASHYFSEQDARDALARANAEYPTEDGHSAAVVARAPR
jgi:hypothetical protein